MVISKTQRQQRIVELLEKHAVTNQTELIALLGKLKVHATQATVSRDLEELGAIKVRANNATTIYAIPELPKDQIAPVNNLRNAMNNLAVEFKPSGNLVVIRTIPAGASMLAAALDRSGMEDILGTVAGDDSVLVVLAENTAKRFVKKLEAI